MTLNQRQQDATKAIATYHVVCPAAIGIRPTTASTPSSWSAGQVPTSPASPPPNAWHVRSRDPQKALATDFDKSTSTLVVNGSDARDMINVKKSTGDRSRDQRHPWRHASPRH
ncbi:MAG: hypothetical protein QM767_01865 [Anaeromyxobacter sp.]